MPIFFILCCHLSQNVIADLKQHTHEGLHSHKAVSPLWTSAPISQDILVKDSWCLSPNLFLSTFESEGIVEQTQ